jgi:hypothetical protein
MSRSGYCDDFDPRDIGIWRAQVANAIRGKRGQALLKEMLQALDSMPNKRLIAGDLEKNGEFCALGAVGAKRGLDMSGIEPEDPGMVGRAFGVAHQLVAEIEWMNDEQYYPTREYRWQKMRDWVESQIRKPVPESI